MHGRLKVLQPSPEVGQSRRRAVLQRGVQVGAFNRQLRRSRIRVVRARAQGGFEVERDRLERERVGVGLPSTKRQEGVVVSKTGGLTAAG
jgi:hypothetical protein